MCFHVSFNQREKNQTKFTTTTDTTDAVLEISVNIAITFGEKEFFSATTPMPTMRNTVAVVGYSCCLIYADAIAGSPSTDPSHDQYLCHDTRAVDGSDIANLYVPKDAAVPIIANHPCRIF